jgi:hypothetical protein
MVSVVVTQNEIRLKIDHFDEEFIYKIEDYNLLMSSDGTDYKVIAQTKE